MGAAGLVLLAAGTAVQIYGQQQAAEQQAEMARKDAALKEDQAREVLDRVKINQEILQESGDKLQAQQIHAMSHGITVGTGSPLLIAEQTAYSTMREINNARIEAEFRASQLRAGAAASADYSGQVKKSADLESFGTLLTAAYTGYANRSAFFGKSSPKSTKSGYAVSSQLRSPNLGENYNGRITSSGQWGYGIGRTGQSSYLGVGEL